MLGVGLSILSDKAINFYFAFDAAFLLFVLVPYLAVLKDQNQVSCMYKMCTVHYVLFWCFSGVNLSRIRIWKKSSLLCHFLSFLLAIFLAMTGQFKKGLGVGRSNSIAVG